MGILGKGRFGRVDRRHRLLESMLTKAAPETLEIRCTPAASVMNLTSTGVLSYQAAAGDQNFLEISINGAGTDFVFQDVGAGVTINASNVPGAVQLTPNSVSVPISSSIGSMFVNLSDMNDVIVLLDDIQGRQITVHGGAGDDAIDLLKSTSLTVAFGEAGDDNVWSGQAGSFVLGGDGDDSLLGGDGADSINGGAGNDTLNGADGNDLLGELPASPYALPEIYGLLVYTGLDQPLDYVNQLVTFNRDNPAYVNIVGNNGINPELYYGTGLDFDATGKLYMTIQTNSDFFFEVDRATGAATLIGGSGIDAGYRISDLSWDPVGNRMLALVDYRLSAPGPIPKPRLAEIDLATGAVSFITTLGIDDNQTVALSVDSQGNYYVLGLYSERWYKVDRNSFAVTPLATLPFYPNDWQQGATVDWAHNDILYYAAFAEIDPTTYTNTFYTVNKATGALTTVSVMGLNINPNGSTQYADIAIDPLSSQGYLEPGNDSIYGGAGADTIFSGTGGDLVEGNDGNDFVAGGEDNDMIYGGAGADSLGGQNGDDSIFGGDGNDFVTAGFGADFVDGGTGNDSLGGDSGNDTILGGDGDDFVASGLGADFVEGGTGNDSLGGDEDNDTILGGEGNDSIFGYGGADSLEGGLGNDAIFGGDGNDYLNGEAGEDFLIGENGDDTIYGSDGNDSVLAGTGNDSIFGGADQDVIYGEEGNDTIYGGTGEDSLYGDAGADRIEGEDGNDRIEGGAGGDLICGDAGEDVIYGFSGNDTILGGEGNDWIDGGVDDDLIAGVQGNDSIYGNAGIDSIVGGIGDDLIHGGDDPDLIFGEAGKDTILGGNGNDLMYGGEGDDLIYGGTLTTANTMHMPRNPTLASDGNDTILGGNGFDRVDGGNGDNLLDAGDDGIRETVLAGPGNDMIYNHNYSERGFSAKFSDRSALDGGHNQDLCRGYLVQPIVPLPPANCEDFAAASISIRYYTGQWLIHGRQLVEYPVVERVPGNRKGFTPPFRGAQPRTGARPLIRLASNANVNAQRRSRI